VVTPSSIALPAIRGTLVGPIGITTPQPQQTFPSDAGEVTMTLSGRRIEVKIGPTHVATFDLSAMVDSLGAEAAPPLGQTRPPKRNAIVLEAQPGSDARLAITFLSATGADAQASLQVTGYLLIPAQP
jgi:hypothetical protein